MAKWETGKGESFWCSAAYSEKEVSQEDFSFFFFYFRCFLGKRSEVRVWCIFVPAVRPKVGSRTREAVRGQRTTNAQAWGEFSAERKTGGFVTCWIIDQQLGTSRFVFRF